MDTVKRNSTLVTFGNWRVAYSTGAIRHNLVIFALFLLGIAKAGITIYLNCQVCFFFYSL